MKKITIELKDNQEFKEVDEKTWKIVEVEEKWPKKEDKYFFVDEYGCIMRSILSYDHIDLKRMKIGNFFKTEKDAKNSFIYFAMNSEYDYWHAGMNKPIPELDESVYVEYFDGDSWCTVTLPSWRGICLYRYKHKKYSVEEK